MTPFDTKFDGKKGGERREKRKKVFWEKKVSTVSNGAKVYKKTRKGKSPERPNSVKRGYLSIGESRAKVLQRGNQRESGVRGDPGEASGANLIERKEGLILVRKAVGEFLKSSASSLKFAGVFDVTHSSSLRASSRLLGMSSHQTHPSRKFPITCDAVIARDHKDSYLLRSLVIAKARKV